MKLSFEKIKEVLGKGYKSGNNYHSKCPYCGYNEFGISLDENHVFGCFRKKKCGATGNIFTLLKKLGREDLLENRKTYAPTTKLEILDIKTDKKELEQEFELPKIEKLPLGYKRVFENDYLQNRGVDLQKYEFGVTNIIPKLKNYVIHPIRIENEIYGYIGRATFPCENKYRNSKGTDFANLLGGYLSNKSHTVILVEGVFDMINLECILRQLNLDLVVRCTFGAKISSNQIKMLKKEGFINIILFFDLDVLKIIKQKAFELSKYFEVLVMFPPSEDIDAGDIDTNQFIECFSKLKTLQDIANMITHVNKL